MNPSRLAVQFPGALPRMGGVALVLVLILVGIVPCSLQAQNVTLAPVITTVAGTGTNGYSGDGGPATSAPLSSPYGVAVDSARNLYIADMSNHRIRKVDASGTITTVAGTGAQGYSGDGGPATSARLGYPMGVAVDSAGNLYIADSGNHRIRRVDASGIITTVAGTGTNGYSGDGGPATSAQLNRPADVAVDSVGNLYIAEYANHRIRRVDASGIITTVAGTGAPGYSGDGGPATSAQLYFPRGVAVDSAGRLLIADTNNHRIRGVTASGTITTAAGTGTAGHGGDGGPATSAQLTSPTDVAVDSAGNFYIADFGNNRIRRVSYSGSIITTLAGNGTAGYGGDGGPAASAQLWAPAGVAVDSAGNLYIADPFNNRIRKVARGSLDLGQVSVGASDTRTVFLSINSPVTLSSVQTSGDYSLLSNSCVLGTPLAEGTICALNVQFTPARPGQRWFPLVATDSGSNKYSFGLQGMGVGSAAAFTPGIIGTVAGTGGYGDSGDGGPATSAQLNYSEGVAVDSAGNLYIADTFNHRIRRVDAGGIITTVAGNGTAGYSGDGGPATSAQLNSPKGVAVDSAGRLLIADTNNQRIRRVDAGGIITTVAGSALWGYGGDGGPATSAQLFQPWGVAVDSVGNLYIADTLNARIRRVDVSGVITTVAGTGVANLGTGGDNGDGGPATSAQFNGTTGVAVDSAGNLYIADPGNHRIRRVDTNGIITTVAGVGTAGYSGDGGPATSAQLNGAVGVAVDSAGNLYIADWSNLRIRRVDASGIITTMAGSGAYGDGGDGGPATNAQLGIPTGVAVDSAGNLYIADPFTNNRIRRVDVTTSALAFGPVSVGQVSSPQTVALSDVGNAPLDIGSIDASSNFLLQGVGGDDCVAGTPLAVGATCTLGVAFAPGVAGDPLTGSLTVTDDAFNSPQSVALSGTAVGTPPAFGPHPDLVAEAASTSGAAVTFTVTASNENGPATVACVPASGSTFPLGNTLVACTATDPTAPALQSSTSFTVTVHDTTPPALNLPANIITDANAPDGARVTYTASATDLADPDPQVSCAPVSGSLFPMGKTTVSCTAQDASGNASTGSFTVLVKAAAEQVKDLIEKVKAINMKQGIADSLDSKLQNVSNALGAANGGDKASVCNLMDAFINETEAQSGKALTVEQANQLIAEAVRIRTVLACK